jgi:hypothetical protein
MHYLNTFTTVAVLLFTGCVQASPITEAEDMIFALEQRATVDCGGRIHYSNSLHYMC